MHINALFLCSIAAHSRFMRFGPEGMVVNFPLHLATASLLPIKRNGSEVRPGDTWWQINSGEEEMHAALESGAATLIITARLYECFVNLPVAQKSNRDVIVMDNTEDALFSIATLWRIQCPMPIVAIGGSVGKTTTVDMLASILAVDKLPVFIDTTAHISLADLAISLLHLTGLHALAIFELGSTHVGDMLAASNLLRPTIALVTSVCPAHLEGKLGLQPVAFEQQQVFSYFTPSQVGVVCGDYPALESHCYHHPVVRYGLKHRHVVTAKEVHVLSDHVGMMKTKMVLRIYDRQAEVILPGHHKALVYAALAAASLAHFLYVPFDVIVRGIKAYTPRLGLFSQRFLRNGRGILLHDTHSISPDGVRASLHAVHAYDSKYARKMAVIGSIPDLGSRSSFWHKYAGRELMKTRSISEVILVGKTASVIQEVAPITMNVISVASWDEASALVHRSLAPTDNILLVSGATPAPMQTLLTTL